MVYNKEILGERERERDFDEARDIGRDIYIYLKVSARGLF